MTPETFQKHALAFPEVTEEPHFEKTSFRIRKKIFATMSLDTAEVVLKLSPLEQRVICDNGNGAFNPVMGSWGEKGWTAVNLKKGERRLILDAMACAYGLVAPKSLANVVLPDKEREQ